MNDEIIKLLKQNNFIPTEQPYIWLKELGYDYNLGDETYEEIDLTNDNRRKDIEKIIGKKIKINKEVNKKGTIKTDDIINTHKTVMRETKGNEFKTGVLLEKIGNYNERKKGEDMEAYIYEKDIFKELGKLKAEGIKVPSESTLKRHLKKLCKIMLDEETSYIRIENTQHGIVYKIKQSYDNKYFITIPVRQMNELLKVSNSNMLKLYCVIKYKIEYEQKKNNTNKAIPITRSYLCKGMGLEINEGNKNDISILLTGLRKLGYIKVEVEHIKEEKKGFLIPKDRNYYQLTTLEEWEDLNKNMNKKIRKG